MRRTWTNTQSQLEHRSRVLLLTIVTRNCRDIGKIHSSCASQSCCVITFGLFSVPTICLPIFSVTPCGSRPRQKLAGQRKTSQKDVLSQRVPENITLVCAPSRAFHLGGSFTHQTRRRSLIASGLRARSQQLPYASLLSLQFGDYLPHLTAQPLNVEGDLTGFGICVGAAH